MLLYHKCKVKCACVKERDILLSRFSFSLFCGKLGEEKKEPRMRVRDFTGNWKSTDPLYFAYRQSLANLSNKDIRLSNEWGANEKDTNTEY